MNKHKILITLDGSEFSRLILPWVQGLFRPQDCELILLSVAVEPFVDHFQRTPLTSAQSLMPLFREGSSGESDFPADVPGGHWEELLSKLRHELRTVAQELTKAGYAVSTQVRANSDPAEEIVALVKSEGVNLIAMTTHGRSGAGRLLMGSVAEQVLRKVQVPVMLLRPQ
jgi:nucleotide-binding universal stress UspA family protein